MGSTLSSSFWLSSVFFPFKQDRYSTRPSEISRIVKQRNMHRSTGFVQEKKSAARSFCEGEVDSVYQTKPSLLSKELSISQFQKKNQIDSKIEIKSTKVEKESVCRLQSSSESEYSSKLI